MERALSAPAGMKAINVLYPLHIGSFGGLTVQVQYGMFGLAPLVLFVTGLLMWWNRTRAPGRRRSRTSSHRPTPRRHRAALRRILGMDGAGGRPIGNGEGRAQRTARSLRGSRPLTPRENPRQN